MAARWPTLFILVVATAAMAQPAPPDGGAAPPPHERGHGGGLFISPMGEPFRGPDAMGAWFRGADGNGDGRLSPAECTADAARFFVTLDVNKDGEIDPEELTRYETEIVPEVQSGMGGFDGGGGGERHRGHGGRGGGHRGGGREGGRDGSGEASGSTAGAMPERPQGAARFGLLDLPEPVIAADADFNRGVSRAEFRDAALRRCHLLDRDGDGAVAWAELPTRTPPTRRLR